MPAHISCHGTAAKNCCLPWVLFFPFVSDAHRLEQIEGDKNSDTGRVHFPRLNVKIKPFCDVISLFQIFLLGL